MGASPSIAIDAEDYVHIVWIGRLHSTTTWEKNDWKLLYRTTRPTSQVLPRYHIESPTNYELAQNFPNPFNMTTQINFSIPTSTTISLTILDFNGRIVKKLADNQLFSAGNYQVSWDGANATNHQVASGLYLYQLKTDGFLQYRKMLLLK